MWRVLAVVVLLAGCGGVPSDVGGGDASARSACRLFVEAVSELDVSTYQETRGRLQAMHERARVSDDRRVASGARTLLAGFTDDDPARVDQATRQMVAACDL